MAGKAGSSQGKHGGRSRKLADRSHFIHTQEADGEQEVEPGCKISKLTPK